MGKQKYQDILSELFKISPVVSFSSINRLLNNKRKKNQYAKQLIRNLIIKKKIKKLTKGFYTIYDDPSFIVFSFKPAYLGLQDALSKHNIWEQETIPIIITARKVRQGIRTVNGVNVLIRRLDKKYFFGIDYLKEGEVYLPYSNIEKTLIDLVYFNENISTQTLNSIKKRINMRLLKSYLRNYSLKFRKRVIFLMNKK